MDSSKVWNYWASRYEKLWVQKYSLGPTRRRILEQLDNIIKDKGHISILDMGCGTGQLVEEIRQRYNGRGITITGVDISKDMIERAREKNTDADFIVSSVEDFKGEDQSYDVIVCSHSFPYYSHKVSALKKLSNLLKDGGCLLLAQASQNNIYDKVALFFVKLTTSRADYPSRDEVIYMAKGFFKDIRPVLIKEKRYMPSIYLFLCMK